MVRTLDIIRIGEFWYDWTEKKLRTGFSWGRFLVIHIYNNIIKVSRYATVKRSLSSDNLNRSSTLPKGISASRAIPNPHHSSGEGVYSWKNSSQSILCFKELTIYHIRYGKNTVGKCRNTEDNICRRIPIRGKNINTKIISWSNSLHISYYNTQFDLYYSVHLIPLHRLITIVTNRFFPMYFNNETNYCIVYTNDMK